MKEQQWIEVFQDEEFARKILAMEPEEALAALKEHGYDFTREDIAEMAEAINATLNAHGGEQELSEKSLENVAGGLSRAAIQALAKLAAKSAVFIVAKW